MSGGVVLVTGAATTMGKAVVRRLAFAGYKVAAADSCANATGKVADDNKKVGGKVTAFAVDIMKPEHRTELIARVEKELGGLDSLVIVPPKNEIRGDIMDTTLMQFDSMFSQVCTVPFRLTQAALPTLKKSSNGSVVFMTSSLGYSPNPEVGLLSVASTSVLSLCRAVSQSAAKQGVRVNSVCTAMVEGDGTGAIWDAPTDQIREGLTGMIPLGKIGRPSDAASLVEFLISKNAKYITGENCMLNGGVSFRL